MDKYQEIIDLISKSGDIVEFADYGNGVSDAWIKKAELRLGFKLSKSYKWWLKNYSGGEIYGEEIFSIYEIEFDEVVGGDLVYMHELNQKTHNSESNEVIICESNDDVYYFNLNVKNAEGDFPVFSLNKKTQYAADFIEFLKKRITYEH
jgi:hypothetical protein